MALHFSKFNTFLILSICIFPAAVHTQLRSTRSDIALRQLTVVGHNTVRIKRDPVSGNLFVLQNNGIIQRVNIESGGTATLTTVYTTSDHGLNAPLGMTFGNDGTLYLVGNDSTGQFGTATVVKGVRTSPGSEIRIWSIVAQTVPYPYGNIYNHRMNGIIVSTNGDSLYVNSGAATDHGEMHGGYREVGLTSIILKLPINGDNIILQDDREWLRSNGYLYAEGIRNTFDFAYAANGDLFGPENSDDRDDPEELNWIREGRHYGFPWRIGGDNTPQQYTPYNPHTDPLLRPGAWGGGQLYVTYSNDPTYPSRPAGVVFTEPIESIGPDADKFRDTLTGAVMDAGQLGVPMPTFTPHRSIDGIVFDNDSLLDGDLKGGAFVISFSNSNLITALGDTSQDLLHISLTKNGENYTARVMRLLSGFNSPLGIEIVGNRLYVAESGLQNSNPVPKLWEITLPIRSSAVRDNGGHSVSTPFNLEQNFPNPANPSTTIRYFLPSQSNVQLRIFDVLGREVRTLVDQNSSAGEHIISFNTANLNSGVYFYQLKAGSFTQRKKMLIVK